MIKSRMITIELENLKNGDGYMYWGDLLIYFKPVIFKQKIDGEEIIIKRDALRIQRTEKGLSDNEVFRIFLKLKSEEGIKDEDPDKKKLSENGPIILQSDNYQMFLGDDVVIQTEAKKAYIYDAKKEE